MNDGPGVERPRLFRSIAAHSVNLTGRNRDALRKLDSQPMKILEFLMVECLLVFLTDVFDLIEVLYEPWK